MDCFSVFKIILVFTASEKNIMHKTPSTIRRNQESSVQRGKAWWSVKKHIYKIKVTKTDAREKEVIEI